MDETLYDRFEPAERLTLVLEAMARNDSEEANRLHRSCPRRTYTGPDLAFDERYDLLYDTVLVVCIDLRSLWCRLDAVRGAIETMRFFVGSHHIAASLAFVDGARCVQGLSQLDFFVEAVEHDKPRRPRTRKRKAEEEQRFGEDVEEFAQRMSGVEARAELSTAEMVGALECSAILIAKSLAETWEAVSQFSESRIGIKAEKLIAAWGIPIAKEVLTMLACYPNTKRDPEKVKAYFDAACDKWDERFGKSI